MTSSIEPRGAGALTADRGAVGTRWVTLARACEIVGVNESTVRRWADSGEIRCFRTPGGHRRFAESDLTALTEGRHRAEHELEAAAVSRIRRQLHRPHGDNAWYRALEEDDRDALRPLGRRLVELAGEYIVRSRPRGAIEREVDEIGQAYGQSLLQRGTALSSALKAFTFFRRALDDAAKQLAERSRLGAEDAATARAEIAGLADRVLLGVAAAYDGAVPPLEGNHEDLPVRGGARPRF